MKCARCTLTTISPYTHTHSNPIRSLLFISFLNNIAGLLFFIAFAFDYFLCLIRSDALLIHCWFGRWFIRRFFFCFSLSSCRRINFISLLFAIVFALFAMFWIFCFVAARYFSFALLCPQRQFLPYESQGFYLINILLFFSLHLVGPHKANTLKQQSFSHPPRFSHPLQAVAWAHWKMLPKRCTVMHYIE